jgi:hypothetical protein
MKRHFWIRAKLFFRQARWGFAVIGTWFLLGTLVFRYAGGLRFQDAILNAFYLKKSDGEIWDLYSFWGQCVLFGIVISIFFLQALQRYNPQEGCRMLAGELRNHVIVVGYTHLGTRIVEHLREAGLPYVLVDRDPAVVDDLVRLGEIVHVAAHDDVRLGILLPRFLRHQQCGFDIVCRHHHGARMQNAGVQQS